MKPSDRSRIFIALLMMSCLLLAPLTVYAKKGEKNYNQGLKYEAELKWDLAAQEFALALAQLPSDAEYRLHYQRAMFNASQMFMQRGRALEEKNDYVGAYNAYRQAYAYDPVNELAVAEMNRMLRLQEEKSEGKQKDPKTTADVTLVPTAYKENANGQKTYGDFASEQRRQVSYTGDLRAFIKETAKLLNLNVIFDSQTQQFRQGSPAIELSLLNVTPAEALDYLFLQQNLFFQKIGRRTIVVADQSRRPVYQQLVIRTFYLSNAKPEDVQKLLQTIIPAQSGRLQTQVVVDKETNSITLRDTAENIRMMGDLIQNIDKDRPEVVMDVNIYEVSKDALLQVGNQIGTDTSLSNIGGGYGGILSAGSRSPFVDALKTAAAGTAGAAIFLPASSFSLLERKNNAKLLVSTQIHAFNNEESSARIGQRVPVQTAQVFPFSNTGTTGGSSGGAFGGGGFPVINFEPIGLTLKFTPIIYPNKDVQVKMSIESKDVFNANTFTPTFIERTIQGTARIQNNRTMMLASVAQDRDSRSRRGIPLLGLIPILGRLFSTPTQDNSKTDIVIAVTPRVLRAPEITPRDLQDYPSGSMQNPTLNSLAKMIADENREEQLALAKNPQNASSTAETKTNQTQAGSQEDDAPKYVPASKEQTNNSASVETKTVSNENNSGKTNNAMPAVNPKPIDANAGTKDITVKPTSDTVVTSDSANKTPLANAVENAVNNATKTTENTVNLSLALDNQVTQGNKRRVALMMDTNAPLGMASLAVRFDPKAIVIKGITFGNMFENEKNAPAIAPFITPDGVLLLNITPSMGSAIKGKGALVYFEIEMLKGVESAISFDASNLRLITSDGRTTLVQLLQDAIIK